MATKEEIEGSGKPSISRNEFLRIGSMFGLGGLVLLETKNLKRGLQGLQRLTENPHELENRSAEDVLLQIWDEHNIYIPQSEGEYRKISQGITEKNTRVSLDEAIAIKNSLDLLPKPKDFVQLIIPFRNSSAGAIAGGSLWGLNWPFFLNSSIEYPHDRFLSKFSGLNLVLPNAGLKDRLPPINSQTNFLPLLSESLLNQMGIRPTNEVQYPWTNHGERLKQTILHEIGGHGVIELAGMIKVNYDPRAKWEASAMSLFGGLQLDTYHPVLSSFAKVNGWRLIQYGDYMAQWGDTGKRWSEKLKESNPEMFKWLVWDRDPEVWGPIENRKIRISTYASYATPNEAFADFFMFYVLSGVDPKRYNRSLLTKEEIAYFDRMFLGLSRSPEVFLKSLIKENPGPSFNREMFRDKFKKSSNESRLSLVYPHQIA